MRQAVIDKFSEFSVIFEGHVPYLYKDILGYLTTAEGVLVDPIGLALALPWVIDGRPATEAEVRADWARAKAEADPKRHHKYAEKLTRIRLTEVGIEAAVRSKLLSNEKVLRRDFKHWDDMTADAQLATCSMAWALGAGFAATFKNYARAANMILEGGGSESVVALNYAGMLEACRINAFEQLDENGKHHPKYNPGVIPRNRANELCLANAHIVAENDMDPDVLHWPEMALPSPRTIPAPSGDGDLQLAAVRAFGVRTDEIGDIGREARRELSQPDTIPSPPPDDFDPDLDKDTKVESPSKRSV